MSAIQDSGVPDPPVWFPDFSPAEKTKPGATDFVQLNDASKISLLKKELLQKSTLQCGVLVH